MQFFMIAILYVFRWVSLGGDRIEPPTASAVDQNIILFVVDNAIDGGTVVISDNPLLQSIGCPSTFGLIIIGPSEHNWWFWATVQLPAIAAKA